MANEQQPESATWSGVQTSRAAVVRVIRRAIARRRPLAVVRFGEGEGRLLCAEPGDEESMRVARNKVRRQSGLRLDDGQVLELKAQVMRALDGADVVGIRGGGRMDAEHVSWLRRIDGILARRIAAGRPEPRVSDLMLNRQLGRDLGLLVGGCPRVSLVSCRDLRELLTRDHGVEDVAVYQVPSQYIVRDVDGGYEARLHDEPIWPDHMDRLRRDLVVREPGEVFLVGAGLFGKDLCIDIRDRGGIALDLGSTLDQLAGKVTRGKNKPAPYKPR